MSGDTQGSGPSLRVLWRLTLVPAALLLVLCGFSLWVLTPWGPALTDDRLSALWVLLASLVATVGGFVGALLTAGSQENTEARLSAQTEADRLSQEKQGERTAAQARIDSTIQGIRIFELGNSRTMAAGVFAMVVRLGEPVVALRMLDPVMGKQEVDPSTAVWVIDEILRSESVDLTDKRHAAFLLLQHSGQLTTPAVPGGFAWPEHVYSTWPADLDAEAGVTILWALADLLTSRTREWWTRGGGDWSWAVTLLFLALRDDPDEGVKDTAGWTLRVLHDARPELWSDHWLSGPDHQRMVLDRGDVGLAPLRQDRLAGWMRDEAITPPSPGLVLTEQADRPGATAPEASPPPDPES